MIIQLIRNIHGKLERTHSKKNWKKQALIQNIDISEKRDINDEIHGKRIVIVSPHADDELIGNFGILFKASATFAMFYAGLLGHDAGDEKIANIRLSEYKSFCKSMSVKYVENDYTKSWISNLNDLLVQFKPEVIIIPSPVDWHGEHREVSILTLKLIEKLKLNVSIFIYQVTVPISKEWITSYCAMNSDEDKTKWAFFLKFYKSQSFMPLERFKAAERVFVVNNNQAIVEPYGSIETDQIDSFLVSYSNIDSKELDQLKYSINDLLEIRKRSEIIYSKIST